MFALLIQAQESGYASAKIDSDWFGVHYNATGNYFTVCKNGRFLMYSDR